jgi:hypothetical protein
MKDSLLELLGALISRFLSDTLSGATWTQQGVSQTT